MRSVLVFTHPSNWNVIINRNSSGAQFVYFLQGSTISNSLVPSFKCRIKRKQFTFRTLQNEARVFVEDTFTICFETQTNKLVLLESFDFVQQSVHIVGMNDKPFEKQTIMSLLNKIISLANKVKLQTPPKRSDDSWFFFYIHYSPALIK